MDTRDTELETLKANSKEFIEALVNLNAKFYQKNAALNIQSTPLAARVTKIARSLSEEIIS